MHFLALERASAIEPTHSLSFSDALPREQFSSPFRDLYTRLDKAL